MAQRRIMSVVLLMLMLGMGESTCWGLVLSEYNQTAYAIVVAQDAMAAETTAATELVAFLKQVTGADFPIIKDTAAGDRTKRIFVGSSSTVACLLPDVNWKTLASDEIVLKTVGDDLILAGGRPRGTLYAVYTFLEDVIGCRWWTSTESDIPKKETLEIPILELIYTPKFYYRETLFADVCPPQNYQFMARSKLNGHHHPLPEAYGGYLDIIGFVHTFNRLLSPEKYFKAHPEWYSLNGGKRSDKSQLCLTNKEMQQELIKNAVAWMKEQPGQTIISISQNDGGSGGCECDACNRIVRREGSQMGPLLYFINQVAQELEKHRPGMCVETLAYTYTRQPPRFVRPKHNVIIRLCNIETNFLQPLDSPTNIAFANQLQRWSLIAPRLFIWDYVVNFDNAFTIHPNLQILGPNLRFFADHKVGGVFEQGEHSTLGSEFQALKVWMIAHLMWNPYQDDKKVMSEFLNGYYGAAGPFIAKYIECMRLAFLRDQTFMTCGNTDLTAVRLAEMNTATALFDQACVAVEGLPTYENRVWRALLPLERLWIAKWNDFKEEASRNRLPFKGPANPQKAMVELQERARQLGVTGLDTDQLAKMLTVPASIIPANPPDPKLGINLKGKAWIDVQEKQFRCPLASPQCRAAKDSLASDGVAVVMHGNLTDWLVQYDLKHEGRYRYYVIVRCEVDRTQPLTGTAFSCGIYDAGVQRAVPVQEVVDCEYHAYDLGVYEPFGKYLYIAPAANRAIKEVYVDRIILVKEN